LNVTLDEAIDVYAKAYWSRFKSKALKNVQNEIEILQLRSDLEGIMVWKRVMAAIVELQEAHAKTPLAVKPN
jgi:hypothetical protein